jgi:hypothetical protein
MFETWQQDGVPAGGSLSGGPQERALTRRSRDYSILLEEIVCVLGINAAVQAVFGLFEDPAMLVTAGVITVLTWFISHRRSRPAALLLLAFALAGVAWAMVDWLSFPQNIGIKACFDALLLPAACFAVQATFRLHHA